MGNILTDFRSLHPEIKNTLRNLHPLRVVSAGQISSEVFPGKKRKRIREINRLKLTRLLELATYLEPQGDQQVGALAYFGFRWIALSVLSPVKRAMSQRPLDRNELIRHFPDLAWKFHIIGPISITPKDLHEFLAGVYGWQPYRMAKPQVPLEPKKRKPCNFIDPHPAWTGVSVGVPA